MDGGGEFQGGYGNSEAVNSDDCCCVVKACSLSHTIYGDTM